VAAGIEEPVPLVVRFSAPDTASDARRGDVGTRHVVTGVAEGGYSVEFFDMPDCRFLQFSEEIPGVGRAIAPRRKAS
jgi:hypothetical protein